MSTHPTLYLMWLYSVLYILFYPHMSRFPKYSYAMYVIFTITGIFVKEQ